MSQVVIIGAGQDRFDYGNANRPARYGAQSDWCQYYSKRVICEEQVSIDCA